MASSDLLLIGVDEVGRGPLAGPVVACACILPDGFDTSLLRDSKALSAKRRAAIAAVLRDQARFHIAAASVVEIDQLNILQATFLAMRRAVAGLGHVHGEIMIDGNQIPKDLDLPARAVVGGDAQVPAIMAASILAKEHRDALMRDLGAQFPDYGWDKNAGYGTAGHLAALRRFGPTPHHRTSFAPVREALHRAA